MSSVFETKSRAPYKIVFEVCRLSELITETMEEEQESKDREVGAVVSDKPPKDHMLLDQNANDDVKERKFVLADEENDGESINHKQEPEEAVFDEDPAQP